MKNVFYSLVALVLLSFNAYADKTELFNYDEQAVITALAEVEQLNQFVEQHPEMDYSQVASINPELVANISEVPMAEGINAKRNRVFGIPSWLWGCVFGVAGVAVVYFVAEDKEETKEALIGCAAAAVVGIVVWLLAFGAAASTASSTI